MNQEQTHLDQTRQDHDLLVRLDEKVNLLITQMTRMAENNEARLAHLEANAITHEDAKSMLSDAEKTHTDHEKRLRYIERYGGIALGGIYLLYALFQFGYLDSVVQKAVRTELSQYEVKIINP